MMLYSYGLSRPPYTTIMNIYMNVVNYNFGKITIMSKQKRFTISKINFINIIHSSFWLKQIQFIIK